MLLSHYVSRSGLVLSLTLTTTVSHPPRGAWLATQILAAVGVLFLPLIRWDVRYWGLLAAVTAMGTFSHPLVDLDNHHFLHVYWLLAITLACLARNQEATLARTARYLIGLLFLFATLWKLLTPDFTDGSFLAYALSSDTNVSRVPIALGWLADSELENNRATLAPLYTQAEAEVGPVQLFIPPSIDRIARPVSLVTLAMEAAIALAFLLPLRGAWTLGRDVSLFAFVLATYPAVPVIAFAVLLIAMSLSTSRLRASVASLAHIGVLLAVAVAGIAVPWLAS